MSLWFGLENLSPVSFGGRQTQREFAQFAVGISEFHHESHVRDIAGAATISMTTLNEEEWC